MASVRDKQDGFVLRVEDDGLGGFIYRRVPIKTQVAESSVVKDDEDDRLFRRKRQKISSSERAMIFAFCKRKKIPNEYPYLLNRAEQRSLRHMKLLRENPAYAARGDGTYTPVTEAMLERWLNPGLFDQDD